jgi:Ca2+-binding RTX toxin-like protein
LAGGLVRGGAGFDWLINASVGPFSGVLNVDFTATEAEAYWGGAGAERVDASGASAAVTLYGNGGADQLIGGAGNDVLLGGDSADLFQFVGAWGRDTIGDFEDGVDEISISAAGLTEFSQLSIVQDGSDILVSYDGSEIRIANISIAEIDASDFSFP